MAKKKQHSFCTIMRRKLVKHSTINVVSGEKKEKGSEWVTEPCGVPLFGKRINTGVCRSCTEGWTHPNNYPVDENGKKLQQSLVV